MALSLITPLALVLVSEPRLQVCTNKACRKAGALDTLALLQSLASTAPLSTAPPASLSAALLQQAAAQAAVAPCGCLGKCGGGPNVLSSRSSEVFRDVFKPITALALLQDEAGVEVPDVAAKACLAKMYADRALRTNKPDEAVAYLTKALNEAGGLRSQGAYLLYQLLEQRASVYDTLKAPKKAEADRTAAERMLTLPHDYAVTVTA
ncbi:hypothetical protein AB1Y20_023551 [Prymnesium parvum]|uniref:ER membrane protein complex subunit 2 n=1 Tax=Prymnesium parvum TaxID=97485 RepID=A0AB34JEQ8_PRYPA